MVANIGIRILECWIIVKISHLLIKYVWHVCWIGIIKLRLNVLAHHEVLAWFSNIHDTILIGLGWRIPFIRWTLAYYLFTRIPRESLIARKFTHWLKLYAIVSASFGPIDLLDLLIESQVNKFIININNFLSIFIGYSLITCNIFVNINDWIIQLL